MQRYTKKIMGSSEWDTLVPSFSKAEMDERIKSCILYRNWKHTIHMVSNQGIPFDKLSVAEVGSGTGTFSLTMALLGASVTLIDFNEKSLAKAEAIYRLYGCNVKLVKADCLDLPSDEIKGKFDIVVSMGLAEHFTGGQRERVILYHKLLLKESGFVSILVPNRFSPFYRLMKAFREVTGTWQISIEIPFSAGELRSIAERHFNKSYILGKDYMLSDSMVYLQGLISAIIDALPFILRKELKKLKRYQVQPGQGARDNQEIKQFVQAQAQKTISSTAEEENPSKWKQVFSNTFCSIIVLFAFNQWKMGEKEPVA